MRYAKVRAMDIANGPGVRVTLFVQGCNHHCPGCFNQDTWDFNGGKIFNQRVKAQFLDLANDRDIVGFSILGGEPLQQGEDMLDLVKSMKEQFPNKTIWMWTGYTYESLNDLQREIVSHIDVLVDGPFIQEQKCLNEHFKGSRNQRIIDIQKTLAIGEIQPFQYLK